MEEYDFYEEQGFPFTGRKKERLKAFLSENYLHYDEQIEATVNLMDSEGYIAATCSLHDNVLKCIAVSKNYQGYGLSTRVVTQVCNLAVERGKTHLFLFTKPENKQMFIDMGFYPILETKDVLLTENSKNGIKRYVAQLEQREGSTIGAIVVNCNPFTNGHRYLIETASKQCDVLHLFVLSEDKSEFSADVRYELVRLGVADLANVLLHKTSDYLISSAVFPTYFIKERTKADDANCELDIRIFCEYFAKSLGITKRFVGTEPNCGVTNAYNNKMKELLPQYGIEFIEIERKQLNGMPISASAVRRLLREGNIDEVAKLVPSTTFAYLKQQM
ncbi:[citrate (pro-3S)-lyase] ligase [Oscillospiraceae bacterium LTW-04]|nr:[citrate (pro-3S)-lyase] ligase [Oscillospiraceae bacterium MB24-C1]